MDVDHTIPVSVDADGVEARIGEVIQETLGGAVIDAVRNMPVLIEGWRQRLNVSSVPRERNEGDAQHDDTSHRHRETKRTLLASDRR